MTPTTANLQRAAAVAGDGVAVVAATGPANSSITSLLNQALSLNLPSPALSPSASASSPPPRAKFSPTLVATAAPSGPLILALDPVDPPTPATDSAPIDKALALAVSVSGVLLFSARMHDFARARAAGVPRVMAAVERSLALRVARVAPVLPARRLLVVAVRDFDAAVVPEGELRAAVERALTSAYEGMDAPAPFVATTLADVFDVQIVLLRNETHCRADYDADVRHLAAVLRDANKTYADAGMTASGWPAVVDKVANAIASDGSHDLPSDRELRATFACDTTMQSVLAKFRNTAKNWKTSVDAGRIIRNYGTESDRVIKRTLEVFDKDASVYKTTRAFARKREELTGFLLSDSYALFAKQILKVRENAYQLFRSHLARIRITDQVEKNVRLAVKEADSFFVREAESLRSKLGNWRFDSERQELVNHMRDDATERLQLARLQGNYVPHMRTPIAFAFHTLLLAPFGKDSRFAHPHAEDMKPNFDPDKAKQPSMMRLRPYQRGHNVKANNRDERELTEEVLDLFSPLHERAANSGGQQ